MSLLSAHGYQAAVQETCDTPEYHLPLVCWRDDGSAVRGMVLYRGALRPAEQVPGFRRYLASEDLEQYAMTGPWPLLAATA
ncbi:DUF6253 family protein [Streptomyces anulatus]|uniref:GNAT family N-acetyltransferase n=1 Tax=Streptomyces anulatus TaxID=1892 RepID=A0ABZ1ZH46_STRAQ|nr:DUF6253 family protein [Streptomyces anulatus]WST86761.1 hypothetical protein OG238_21315 [Streptomyces anulatus]WSU30531.1 hypothetical protein OG391_20005 [Streptomyces anulatus]WSU90608.1 hypothetical protein OG575_18895 [Streptomyces anulatus]